MMSWISSTSFGVARRTVTPGRISLVTASATLTRWVAGVTPRLTVPMMLDHQFQRIRHPQSLTPAREEREGAAGPSALRGAHLATLHGRVPAPGPARGR
jgi:hypothetical protein